MHGTILQIGIILFSLFNINVTLARVYTLDTSKRNYS